MGHSLGTKITLLRKFVGLTQKELAGMLNIHKTTLSEYEQDHHTPGIEVLMQIANTCKMHPSYFFDNILPTRFYQVMEDLKYAYYLSALPEEARRYLKETLTHLYSFSVLEKANFDIKLLLDDSKEKIQPYHKDYFDYIKKKFIEGDLNSEEN